MEEYTELLNEAIALLQQLSPAQFDEILGQLCAKNVRQKDEQQQKEAINGLQWAKTDKNNNKFLCKMRIVTTPR